MFVVYQQIENHVLNPVIMSRTVRLNPLWVILSVLAGAQIAGFIGALLAIPAAGAIQVVARYVWGTRRGLAKEQPPDGPRSARSSEAGTSHLPARDVARRTAAERSVNSRPRCVWLPRFRPG